jgi:hypothetical protein
MNRTGLPFFGNATCSSMSPAPSVSALQASAAQYPAGLPLDVYPADEIGGCTAIYPTLKQWAQNAHAAGLKVLVTMTPDPALYDDGSGTGKPAVDYWTMLPGSWPGSLSGIPGTFWSYNDLEGEGYSPKWEIDFLPINFRIQAGFLNQTQGATGLLYWRVDYWPNLATAWDDVLYGPVSTAYWPGEGRLVYPPGQIGSTEPAPSMRLKFLRDGVQDYEYVEMLKNLGQGAWALAQASTVAHDWAHWSQSSSALVSVRDTLGQKLSDLTPQP